MHTIERNNSPTIERDSSRFCSAGHSARPTSTSHSIRPMNRNHCQKRPMSAYSQPWWPNQKLCSRPSFCITASHWPANEPTTMTSRQTSRKFTPSALVLRLMAGDRGRDVEAGAEPGRRDPQHRELRVPGARERVGQDVGELEAVQLLALDLVVRRHRAEQDLHQEQREHDPEVLRGRAHRRRDAHAATADRSPAARAAPRRGRG